MFFFPIPFSGLSAPWCRGRKSQIHNFYLLWLMQWLFILPCSGHVVAMPTLVSGQEEDKLPFFGQPFQLDPVGKGFSGPTGLSRSYWTYLNDCPPRANGNGHYGFIKGAGTNWNYEILQVNLSGDGQVSAINLYNISQPLAEDCASYCHEQHSRYWDDGNGLWTCWVAPEPGAPMKWLVVSFNNGNVRESVRATVDKGVPTMNILPPVKGADGKPVHLMASWLGNGTLLINDASGQINYSAQVSLKRISGFSVTAMRSWQVGDNRFNILLMTDPNKQTLQSKSYLTLTVDYDQSGVAVRISVHPGCTPVAVDDSFADQSLHHSVYIRPVTPVMHNNTLIGVLAAAIYNYSTPNPDIHFGFYPQVPSGSRVPLAVNLSDSRIPPHGYLNANNKMAIDYQTGNRADPVFDSVIMIRECNSGAGETTGQNPASRVYCNDAEYSTGDYDYARVFPNSLPALEVAGDITSLYFLNRTQILVTTTTFGNGIGNDTDHVRIYNLIPRGTD